jgi:hypothetical protein
VIPVKKLGPSSAAFVKEARNPEISNLRKKSIIKKNVQGLEIIPRAMPSEISNLSLAVREGEFAWWRMAS